MGAVVVAVLVLCVVFTPECVGDLAEDERGGGPIPASAGRIHAASAEEEPAVLL